MSTARKIVMQAKWPDGSPKETLYEDGTREYHRRPEDQTAEAMNRRWEEYYRLHPEKRPGGRGAAGRPVLAESPQVYGGAALASRQPRITAASLQRVNEPSPGGKGVWVHNGKQTAGGRDGWSRALVGTATAPSRVRARGGGDPGTRTE